MIGETTAGNMITETCTAIIEELKDYVVFPSTEQQWYDIAARFFNKTGVPNFLGAIDGKHIWVQKPPNSGSAFKCYKNGFSTVLTGICDSDYKFIYYSVGSYGSESDGGIFKNSVFYNRLIANDLNTPPPQYFPCIKKNLGFYFYGDEAFGIGVNILRPFGGQLIPESRRYYNYRMTQARISIEQCFGILVKRFRIFRSPIEGNICRTDLIVGACVTLHNYLRTMYGDTDQILGEYQNEEHSGNVDDITEIQIGSSLRDALVEFFSLQKNLFHRETFQQ